MRNSTPNNSYSVTLVRMFFFLIFILVYSTVYYKSDILIEPIICLMVWEIFFNLFCFQIKNTLVGYLDYNKKYLLWRVENINDMS